MFLGYFCKAGLLPLQVNVDSWEIRPEAKSLWKKWTCHVSFGVLLLNTLYKNGSLVYEFVFAQDTPLHQTVIHMVLAGASAMMSFSYYIQHVRFPGTFVKFAGMTLKANVTGSKHTLELCSSNRFDFLCRYNILNTESMPSLEKMEGKRWIHRLMERSPQDLIALGLPYMFIISILIISVSFAYDPTMKLLLYALVPETWKTWPWVWGCFTVEFHFFVMFAPIACPTWQLQVISFELINMNLGTIVSTAMKR